MEIKYAKSIDEAKEFTKRGYVPIDCFFDEEEDPVLQMLKTKDFYRHRYSAGYCHRGKLSFLPCISVQVVDEFQNLEYWPFDKFVVNGYPSLDVCFSIAVLAGLIQLNKEALAEIAEQIQKLDANDPSLTTFREWLLFDFLMETNNDKDELSFYKGVCTIRDIIHDKKDIFDTIESCAMFIKNKRNLQKMEELKDSRLRKSESFPINEDENTIIVIDRKTWDLEDWHEKRESGVNKPKWKNPIVIESSSIPKNNYILITCVDEETAERLFGQGGLCNIYPLLKRKWTGTSIFGNTRFENKVITREDLIPIVKTISVVAAMIRREK